MEDLEALRTYVASFSQYRINIVKGVTIKVEIRPRNRFLLRFGGTYVAAIASLPRLEILAVNLDFGSHQLNLEELSAAIEIARSNPSLVGIRSHNLFLEPAPIEQPKHLLRALLLRNALIRGTQTHLTYTFSSLISSEIENIIAEGARFAISVQLTFNHNHGLQALANLSNNSLLHEVQLGFFGVNPMPELNFGPRLKSLSIRAPTLTKIDWDGVEKLTLHLETIPLAVELNFLEALGSNSHLRVLQVGWNLSDTGMAALANALRINTRLEILALPDTYVGDAGVQILLSGLTHNQTLQELDLSSTGIIDLDAIRTLCQTHPTLTHIHLGGNPTPNSS